MSYPNGLPDPVIDAQFYAGAASRRATAFAIDATVVGALSALATLALAAPTLGGALFAAAPIWFAVSFLYRWASLSRWSATPGMRLAGVELRDLRGERLGEAQAAFHTAAFLALWPFAIPLLVNLAVMALAADGRGLHDRATGVALINRPA